MPGAVVVVLAGLAGACGGGSPPTAPSLLDGPVAPTAAAVRGMGAPVAINAFATASDTPTLKVTAPTPSAPMNDAVVPSLHPTLSVTMSTGDYVQASGLHLGFALWQVGTAGGVTLVEADAIPQAVGTTAYRVVSDLAHDTQYRWRSRAVLDGAYGPWSNTASFRTPVPPPPPPPPAPPLPSDAQARYRVTLESDWSAATHPQDYPAGAHYSPILVATHLATATFWQSGMLASSGIERMAEEGSQSPLDGEVAAAIASGAAESFVRGGGLGFTPGIEQVEFDITTGFPYVTVVSMIAPSPDWFVGVDGLPLIANGQWRDEVVVALFPWDAGTDNGASYESGNVDAVPAQPISLLQRPPVQVGGAVRPFGRFIFRRIE
jgi:hypothetical protein